MEEVQKQKYCSNCKFSKPLSDFYLRNKKKSATQRVAACKICSSKTSTKIAYEISDKYCVFCNNKLLKYQKVYCSILCLNRDRINKTSNESRQNTNKKISQANKKYYNNTDPEIIAKIKIQRSLNAKKQWSNPEFRAKISVKRRKMWESTEFRENMRNTHAVGFYNSLKLNKILPYASTYEALAFQILDADPEVIFYEQEPFTVQFNWKKEIRNCYPDLLVSYKDQSSRLIEVKSTWYLSDSLNAAKIRGMKKFCTGNNIKFSLWTELQLELLRILYLDLEWREKELDSLVTKLKSALL